MKGAPGLTGRPPEDPSLSVRGGYFEGGRTVRSIVSSMHVCPNSASMSCTAHDKKSLQAPFRAAASSGEPGSCYPIPSRTVASFLPKAVQPVSSLPFQVRHPRQVSAQALSLSLSLSLSLLLPLKVSASAYLPYTRAPDLQRLRKTARMSRRTAAILVPVAGAGSEPWRTSCVTGNVGSGLRPWVSHASKEKRHDEENLGF